MPGGWASICGSIAAIPTGARGCCSSAAATSSSRSRTISKKGVSDAPDQLWGLSWRAPDIAKANERLKKAGVEVSEPRNGRRPGTQVFSVQSHTANVPTIVIGGLEHWS